LLKASEARFDEDDEEEFEAEIELAKPGVRPNDTL
jgi:hypothetical protein